MADLDRTCWTVLPHRAALDLWLNTLPKQTRPRGRSACLPRGGRLEEPRSSRARPRWRRRGEDLPTRNGLTPEPWAKTRKRREAGGLNHVYLILSHAQMAFWNICRSKTPPKNTEGASRCCGTDPPDVSPALCRCSAPPPKRRKRPSRRGEDEPYAQGKT